MLLAISTEMGRLVCVLQALMSAENNYSMIYPLVLIVMKRSENCRIKNRDENLSKLSEESTEIININLSCFRSIKKLDPGTSSTAKK